MSTLCEHCWSQVQRRRDESIEVDVRIELCL